MKEDDKNYIPADDDEDSDNVDFDDEGVAEGKDSVLAQKVEDREEMDTIAKYAGHNYYLRSLNKAESFPMTSIAPAVQSSWGPTRSAKASLNIRAVGGTEDNFVLSSLHNCRHVCKKTQHHFVHALYVVKYTTKCAAILCKE